ncbi:MAG: secretin and TonB N-terminal domain-containing protein [Candidatus Omnitrophica bacterium]|nr:secretin and TonB N-terminal domain-containing protein [Candidatus Omnitrophota bacterium]
MNRRIWQGVIVLMGLALAAGVPPGWAQEEAEDSAAQEAAASAPASEGSEAESGLISIDFKDADIRQVLRIISLKSGVDIVAGNDVEGVVTIKLTSVPWEEALDIILRTYGFSYERKGRIVRVMTLAALEQEALDTEVFPLDYAKAKDVPAVINEMLSDRGRVKFDERTNTVIVTDVPSSLFQIKEVVKRLDQRTPQVLIETRIVETKLEKDEHLGIRWSDSFALTQTQTSYPSTFPFMAEGTLGWLGDNIVSTPPARLGGPTSLLDANPTTTLGEIGIGTLSSSALAMTLNSLKQRSDTKVVSNPTLTVLDNQQAKIHIGEEFPVPNFSVDPSTGNTTVSGFQTRTIGTVLTVTPHVNPSNEIVVDLKPEIIAAQSNATFNVSGSQSVSLPRFSIQTVQTAVRIQDGQTIAIGGLVKDLKVSQENKVPILGDIPILGLLFSNNRTFGGSSNPTLKQDLLIFLTVNLTKDKPRTAVASTQTAGP